MACFRCWPSPQERLTEASFLAHPSRATNLCRNWLDFGAIRDTLARTMSFIRRVILKPWGTFAILCGILLWILHGQFRVMDHPKPDTQPFGVTGTFWASGMAARTGLNPYAEYPDTWRPHAFRKNGPIVLDLNLNPPALLPVLSLISRFPLAIVARTSRIASFLLLLGVTAVFIRWYRPERHQLWWLLTGGAVIGTLTLQQDYIFLFAIAAASWWLLNEHRDVAAGICLGVLCTIKPNFGLWPLLLALSGRRKPLKFAAIVFVALSTIPAFVYGPAVYTQWLQALSIDSHSIFPSDVSFVGNATRFAVRPAGYALSAILICAELLLARVGKPTLREASGMAICGALLCSPLAWMHYILILAPLLLSRFWTRREQLAAWLLWIDPVLLEPSNPDAGHWSLAARGIPYLAALLLLLYGFMREPLGGMWLSAQDRNRVPIRSRTVRWVLVGIMAIVFDLLAFWILPFYIAFSACISADFAALILYVQSEEDADPDY